jgi:hypothetical protein
LTIYSHWEKFREGAVEGSPPYQEILQREETEDRFLLPVALRERRRPLEGNVCLDCAQGSKNLELGMEGMRKQSTR